MKRHIQVAMLGLIVLIVGVIAACGGGGGIVSDQFELHWELEGSDLLLAIDTDLPDEGELSVSVNRWYYQVGNDDAYSRDYFHAFEPVSNWRQPRRISLDATPWKADLAAHRVRMAEIPDLAFHLDHVEDTVRIRAVLHTNQDDPRFGERNSKLSGQATHREGDRVLVEAEDFFTLPLDGASEFVAAQAEQHAEQLRLSGERQYAEWVVSWHIGVELSVASIANSLDDGDLEFLIETLSVYRESFEEPAEGTPIDGISELVERARAEFLYGMDEVEEWLLFPVTVDDLVPALNAFTRGMQAINEATDLAEEWMGGTP